MHWKIISTHFPCRFFFDLTQSPIFEYCLASTVLAGTAIGFYNSFNGLFFILTNALLTQLKILQVEIGHLKTERNLREIVTMHHKLFTLCESLKEHYGFVIFTQFGHVTMLLATQGYVLVKVWMDFEWVFILKLFLHPFRLTNLRRLWEVLCI